ncbi:MAG: ornithine cyclodeaminase family protein [Chloroflexi bacterium]|nr:ornithine cyclodeaminase family protein [Chloroflexota bacterium]
MSTIRIISRKEIVSVLTMSDTIEAVEAAYSCKATGDGILWPLITYEFDPGHADLDIKSGWITSENVYGLKLVSWFGNNPGQGLPALHGTTMLFNGTSGAPIGLLDAEYVTGMRTGAAGAIGAKYLARQDSQSLLMVGAGRQALFQISAALTALPGLQSVRVHDPLSAAAAREFCVALPERLTQYVGAEKAAQVNIIPVEDLREAVGASDVIITATPSRAPLIRKDWVRPGTHLSCIGADMKGKQEIDENLFLDARVFVDDIEQALSVGECEIPFNKGILTAGRVVAEIGQVVCGKVRGRLSDTDVTIFDSTGIALQDLMVSKMVLDLASQKSCGTLVEL